LEAAQCAIEIQRALAHRNADAATDRQIELKIGIHIGDVVHRGGDVYGDGVNIASRIEPLAGAGGICVSMDVERQIRNAVETRFEKLAPTELKNISVPMELFRIVLPWERHLPGAATKSTISAPQGRSWIWAATAAVLLLIIGVGWWWTIPGRKNSIGPAPGQNASPARTEAATIPEKSIAVLPFENLSDDKLNAYFAEGIQDEILTRLSKIAALKVISRSSTQKYKSSPDNLREVGQQLGVANLLEGSVQKIANAVHVNVQLIRAATDEHVWAESYNRKLDDVFGVEGEVAAAIADQLKAKLTGAEEKAVTEKATQNARAYDAYLRGVAIERDAYNTAAFEQAMLAYNRAVELDPRFALAWARITVLRSFLFFNGLDLNTNSAAAVKDDVDKLVALAPDAGETWVAQGAYRYRVLRDFNGAVEAYEKARENLPNNSFLLQNLAFVLRRLGRWEESERAFKRAVEVDPRDVSLLTSIGSQFYKYLRRFDDALVIFSQALEISPDSGAAHVGKAGILQDMGRVAEARQELAQVSSAEALDDLALDVGIRQHIYERQFEAAAALMQRRLGALSSVEVPDTLVCSAVVYGGLCEDWSGHREDARQAFLRVIQWIKPTPETVVPLDGEGRPSILALAYAGLGDKNAALQEAIRAVAEYDNDAVGKPAAEAVLAQIQAKFGEIEPAIATIPHLLKIPAGINVADLRLNPLWDPLRQDPRFQKLCQDKQP
jgi:TolB-like protein/Tfp pilus assembly protein PilF